MFDVSVLLPADGCIFHVTLSISSDNAVLNTFLID